MGESKLYGSEKTKPNEKSYRKENKRLKKN
jgi:hypothetical protein